MEVKVKVVSGDATNSTFYDVLLTKELMEEHNWYRGDLVELIDAPRRHLAVVRGHFETGSKYDMCVSEALCINAGLWFNDEVSIVKCAKNNLFKIEIAIFGDDCDTFDTQSTLDEFFQNEFLFPLCKGQIFTIPLAGILLNVKVVDCDSDCGLFCYGLTDIKVSPHRLVVSNTKSANK